MYFLLVLTVLLTVPSLSFAIKEKRGINNLILSDDVVFSSEASLSTGNSLLKTTVRNEKPIINTVAGGGGGRTVNLGSDKRKKIYQIEGLDGNYKVNLTHELDLKMKKTGNFTLTEYGRRDSRTYYDGLIYSEEEADLIVRTSNVQDDSLTSVTSCRGHSKTTTSVGILKTHSGKFTVCTTATPKLCKRLRQRITAGHIKRDDVEKCRQLNLSLKGMFYNQLESKEYAEIESNNLKTMTKFLDKSMPGVSVTRAENSSSEDVSANYNKGFSLILRLAELCQTAAESGMNTFDAGEGTKLQGRAGAK